MRQSGRQFQHFQKLNPKLSNLFPTVTMSLSTTSFKLTTNEGNPAALKPLVAAQLLKIPIELESIVVPVDSRLRLRLPILHVDSSIKLFDTNAMLCFFAEEFGRKKQNALRPALLNMMNFESHTLVPLTLGHLLDKKESTLELVDELNKLAPLLTKQKYIRRDSAPGFEDVVLWSTLYPVLACKEALVGRSGPLSSSVIAWFDNLSKLDAYEAAVQQLKPVVGKEAGKVIFVCNPTASTYALTDKLSKLETPSKKVTVNTEDTPAEAEKQSTVTAEDILAARKSWESKLPVNATKAKRAGQVLPLTGEKNYFITSALPYVNNVPHLGNIIGCVLSADVFARYCRIRGRNTLYICGTDEYGTATETKALEEKLTPQQICDKYHKLHKEIYDWFDISFDYFGRTTTKAQTEVGQEIFLKLHSNGYLKKMPVEQVYCQPCKRFLSDRFVEGTCPACNYEDARGDQCDKCGRLTNSVELKNPRCKVCTSTDVTTQSSDQIFLDLPKLEEEVELASWLDEASQGWTPNARHIAKSWMREGLKERCITRDLKWGTPVPLEEYKDKVFYVWFDAPIGYISMTKSYTNNWKSWWNNENPEISIDYYQFMAKDNVPFHSILFPASLKGTKEPWTLVRHLIATEYLNYEDGKFSKSRGVGVFGNDAIQTGIPADIWRFYLIYVRPENQDSAFSWDDFMTKNNSELLNNLGNFINRSLSFLVKFFDGKIPAINLNEEDYYIIAEINKEIVEYANLLDSCKLREALRKILAVSKIGNGYFQAQQPWTLNKNDADRERCGTICGLGAQIVFLLMTLLEPFMPGVSKKIRDQLNVPHQIFSLTLCPFLSAGHQIGQIAPLFQKLEVELIDKLRKSYAGVQSDRTDSSPSKGKQKPVSKASSSGQVSVEEIKALEAEITKQGNLVRDLKSAKTDKATLKPHIDKLLKLKEELSTKQSNANSVPNSSATENSIPEIESAIAKQGDLVRKLKAEKAAKDILQPEINKLLELKTELTTLQAKLTTEAVELSTATTTGTAVASAEEISQLEAAISSQGNVVRELKAAKAEKSVLQPEIDKLLQLKAQLTLKQGGPSTTSQAPSTKSKKSKKK